MPHLLGFELALQDKDDKPKRSTLRIEAEGYDDPINNQGQVPQTHARKPSSSNTKRNSLCNHIYQKIGYKDYPFNTKNRLHLSIVADTCCDRGVLFDNLFL